MSARSGLDADLAAVLDDPPTIIDASSPDFQPSVDPDEDEFADGWDEQLQALQTLLDEVKSVSNRAGNWLVPSPEPQPTQPTQNSAVTAPPSEEQRVNWTTWLVISSGLMVFVCGAILTGWSVIGGRSELWRVGLPIAFFGQVLLTIGVVLQLEWLWIFHRRTSDGLSRLHREPQRVDHPAPGRIPLHHHATQPVGNESSPVVD